ncbi:oligosaccharide repeat unit polymerase [Marinobacter nauticus]|uniref:oligosaccharide repeat unit polymerase n=1 Tax=Marinobacter nauticus TaxID=2743 RepID=UPI001C991411|nr:oligosaccharide repeat unit polymerase [Marinobacter nauticus]MBY5961341.1 oligosaccharide repeat unit polymerase [Marinobacter nauticus]
MPEGFNRKFLFILFVFSNIAYAFVFYFTGELGGDFKGRGYSVELISMLISLAMVLFTFWFLAVFSWNLVSRIKVNRALPEVGLENWFFDFVFLLLAIYLVIYRGLFGGGVGGHVPENGGVIFHYVAALITPSWLVAIYLFYRAQAPSVLYYVVLLLYVVSGLLSGLTGSLVLIFYLYLTKLTLSGSSFSKVKIMVFFLIGVFVYPLFRIFKVVVIEANRKGGLSEVDVADLGSFSVFLEKGWVSAYFDTLEASFQRLQMVANQYFIIDNLAIIRDLFFIYDGKLFFENVWIYSVFVKRLGIYEIGEYSFQNILALAATGNGTWSSQSGFLGHILLNPFSGFFYLLISIIFMVLLSLLAKLYDKSKYLLNYVWFLVLSYFVHGWYFATVEVLQAFIVFGGIVSCFGLKATLNRRR